MARDATPRPDPTVPPRGEIAHPRTEVPAMKLSVEVIVAAPRPIVWEVVTDIENAATTLSGVERVEVLERPGPGILGLKWRETRTMHGREATETMWITEVRDGSRYATEARSHGAIYRSVVRAEDAPGGTRLGLDFDAEPQNALTRVLGAVLAPFLRRALERALLKDLEDLKAAAEARAAG
jgi:uncharacterized membrane protein